MIESALPLLFIIAMMAVLAVTGNLFSSAPLVIAVQAIAVALNVWARRSFQSGTFRVTADPAGPSIIRGGPYRWLRHPMYSAVLLFVWAGVASHASVFTLTIGVAVTAVAVVRILAEERLLRARYPDYVDYSRSTKALVPFVF